MNSIAASLESVDQASTPVDSSLPDLGDLWLDLQAELRRFIRSKVPSEAATDDLLQTAFLRAHQASLRGVDPEQPRAWLYQIAKNLILDSYRGEGRKRKFEEALEREEATRNEQDQDDSSAKAAADVLATALPDFIARLASPYREALILTELEGLTQAEAAKRESVSLSCMKARVQRARKQLLTALEKCCRFELDGRGLPIECTERSTGASCGSCGSD